MKIAGYSGKSLIEKLGLKDGSRSFFINPPKGFFELLGKIPNGVKIRQKLSGEIDFIHFFTRDKKEFEKKLPSLIKHLSKNGMLWISWPKMSSGISSDLTENIIRNISLENGLVDVKVCAIDENWSGLKLVFRLKDR